MDGEGPLDAGDGADGGEGAGPEGIDAVEEGAGEVGCCCAVELAEVILISAH